MSGMFLSVAIGNAEFMLPRGLQMIGQGPVSRIDDVHQVCTYYRQLGVATMFQTGDADRYHVAAMQSASLYLFELSRQPDAAKVTSFAKPLFDAMVSGYWEAARWIAEASRPTWNPDREYEDDFLYVWFLCKHALLDAPRTETEPLLERYRAVLEGAFDVRLDLCRALLDADDAAFDAELRVLLERRRDEVEALADRGVLGNDASTWVRHFALEGLALLALAERQGMRTGPRYLHCPTPARSESPYEFDRNAWMRVDHRPRRRAD
jgi:hypothetical protein